jgi:hypothetical protein
MTNLINAAKTPDAFNRKATGNNPAIGPLQPLVVGESWVGDTGFNLMVVPSPLGPQGFIVMISQLFETDVFEQVPAPVPNRTLSNGTAQIGAVKYSQKVAEYVSKNILHEETGMWLNQTPGTNPPTTPRNGLEAVHGEPETGLITTNPIIRSGTIPHGNTFQAAGISTNYPAPVSGNVAPYLQLSNFPTVAGSLSFLPSFQDGSDATQLVADYKAAIAAALTIIKLPNTPADVENFINPIGFLNKYATNIVGINSLSVSTTDNLGMVLNVPFERAIAGPQDFICTFMIETIQNTNSASAPETDQNPTFYQIQYLQSIPLLFPNGNPQIYGGKALLFPHWNVNTLIAI